LAEGVVTVVRICLPVVAGDSARVWLYVDESRASAEMDRQLLLVRGRDFVWNVEKELQFREALFGKP